MTSFPDEREVKQFVPGREIPLSGERSRMEPIIMTVEELRAYIRDLPEDVILRVTVQEESHEPEDNRTV